MLKNVYECGEAFYAPMGSGYDGEIFFLLVFSELSAPMKRMKYILEKLGFIVEVVVMNPKGWKRHFRRASLLGDFVYVEKDFVNYLDYCPDYFDYWDALELPPIEPEKDINAVLGPWSYFTDCRSNGVMTYLMYSGFDVCGKHIVVEAQRKSIMEKLIAAGATVTVMTSYTKNKNAIMQDADLIIASPGSDIKDFPNHCPIIDMKKHAWVFDVIGVLAQLW